MSNFTNSPMVVHTNISPNKTSPRNHAIDTITIHCVVGQCTAERIGEIFKPSSKQASSNYGVDKDGRVGMYVEEKDRSWCTSSSANDHRAITIEVASDTTHPYAVTVKAYAALIDLVTDICIRNNIKKLLWKGDKNLIGQVDKQNMTVHRWFANKACPGEYLYERHGAIADEVNRRLGVGTAPPPASSAEIEKSIWDYLITKGLAPCAVAGIMGNLYAESALKPNNLQNSYEKSLGYTDELYTTAVDNGTYTDFVNDRAGYGLAQWTHYTRKQGLLDAVTAAGVSIGDVKAQLDFIWGELQANSALMRILENTTGVLEASNAVLTKYEKPADQSAAVQTKRAAFGQMFYDKYATTPAAPELLYQVQAGVHTNESDAQAMVDALVAAGFSDAVIITVPKAVPIQSYRAQVTASVLNVRQSPCTDSAIVDTLKKGDICNIAEETDGWGKLEGRAGWVFLTYMVEI